MNRIIMVPLLFTPYKKQKVVCTMNPLWRIKESSLSCGELRHWLRVYNVDPIIIQLMFSRGIDTEEKMSS